MDKDKAKTEEDVDMAIPKEPKDSAQPNSSNEHKRQVTKALKEVTSALTNYIPMLWYFLTRNHCFVDGNKRVGFYAASILLKINGHSDNVDDDEAYDKAIQI